MNACEESVDAYKARATNLLSLLHSLPPHKLTPSAFSRLSKLISSELRFFHTRPHPPLNSTNLGYIEAIVQVLQHPDVDAVSAVLHTFKVTSHLNNIPEAVGDDLGTIETHVDIVCTFQTKPVWIVVSDRNPKYVCWSDERTCIKGWKCRVQQLTHVAQSFCVLRPSAVLFCFARGVSDSVLTGFEEEIGASHVHFFEEQRLNHDDTLKNPCLELGDRLTETDDGDWVSISLSREQADLDSLSQRSLNTCWNTFQVNISTQLDSSQSLQHGVFHSKQLERRLILEDQCVHGAKSPVSEVEDHDDIWTESKQQQKGIHPHKGIHSYNGACNDAFLSCLAMICRHLPPSEQKKTSFPVKSFVPMLNIVNLDTTALIALVSELSNGAASTVVNMCNEDLVSKFKSTAQFMKNQAIEELKHPLMMEMTEVFKYRRPFMSETVCEELKSLVLLCGSFKEKVRAEKLLEVILVVPDMPSMRVRNLPETGKIKGKNKVIFGTGDFWQAPTLTANLSFIRAVRQTGMALSILEHHPRALVGEKCP